jgi:hypothetical protein
MSSQQESHSDMELDTDADFAHSNALSEQLNSLLDRSHAQAISEFDNGKRCGGFVAIWHYAATFLHTGILRGKFLQGRSGFLACSVAAQNAYNRSALIYSMAVQEK